MEIEDVLQRGDKFEMLDRPKACADIERPPRGHTIGSINRNLAARERNILLLLPAVVSRRKLPLLHSFF